MFAALLCTTIACSGGPDATPSSTAPTPHESATSGPPRARLTRTIPREGATWITIQTLPGALCTFDVADDPEPGKALELYADGDGLVRLRSRATDRRASSAAMRLDCTGESGAKASYDVDLVVDDAAQGVAAPTAHPSRVRPALAEDPLSSTREELVARDFPPRPDPVKEPQRYAAWLECASRPVNVIEPKIVASPRVHGPSRSAGAANAGPRVTPEDIYNNPSRQQNWSGYAIRNPDVAFEYIYGSWPVPYTTNEGGFWSTTYSAFWVGMGGWPGSIPGDIVQAGTEQDTSSRFWVESSSNYAWYEWTPVTQQSISNFPVNPGDQITTWVWMTDASGYFNAYGNYAHFMIYNATQGNLSVVPPYERPSDAIYGTSGTAEWIVERPYVGATIPDLTNYGSAVMTDAWAEDTNNNLHDYWTDGDAFSDQIFMVSTANRSKVISEAYGWGRGTIYFLWDDHN
jgi:hypothetical protein